MRQKKRNTGKRNTPSFKASRELDRSAQAVLPSMLKDALANPTVLEGLKAHLQALGGAPELESLLAMVQALDSVQEVPQSRQQDIDDFMQEQGKSLAHMTGLHATLLPASSFNARILTFVRDSTPSRSWRLHDILFAQPESVAWDLQTLNAQMDDVLESVGEDSMSVWLACAHSSAGIYGAYARQLGHEPLLFLLKGGRDARRCLQGEATVPYLEQMLTPSRPVKARWDRFLAEQCEWLTSAGHDELEQALKDCDAPAQVLESLPLLSRIFYRPQALAPLVRETISCFASQAVIEAHLLLEAALEVLEKQHSDMKAMEQEMLKDQEKKTKKLRDSLERVETVMQGLRNRSMTLERALVEARGQLELRARETSHAIDPSKSALSAPHKSLGAVLDSLF